MQIVIDILEKDYNAVKEFVTGDQGRVDYTAVFKAIESGTPLPKGHGRLIEDNFEVGPIFDEDGNRVGYKYVTQEDLNNAPTIIEADKEVEM